MRVQEAKQIAREWVQEEGHLPGFGGAFTHGSINWLPDDAPIPPTSDVDLMLVVDRPAEHPKRGKFRHRGVTLEVSFLGVDRLETPERILGDYHLAGNFCRATLLDDPTGRLASLQETVARAYARRSWVEARCRHALAHSRQYLHRRRDGDPLHLQAMAWLFGTGVTTHVLLVAGLENPTVRTRYVAVQRLLADYAHVAACRGLHQELLELLGSAALSQAAAGQHLAAMAAAFDAAQAAIRSPFPFGTDISPAGRIVAVEGSQALVSRGDHREALFWIGVTYCRCMEVLYADAPAQAARFLPGFHRLLADLGIRTPADLEQRCAQVEAFLPRLWTAAEAILAANPRIPA